MKLLLLSVGVLVAFVAVWFFLVVPAERRHHERKLEMLQKRIEKRQSADREEDADSEEASGS